MAKGNSPGDDGDEDEIQKLERQLSEAKKKKQIEEHESEIASLKSKAAQKEPVILVKGKAVSAVIRV
jgi:hypothetical protein